MLIFTKIKFVFKMSLKCTVWVWLQNAVNSPAKVCLNVNVISSEIQDCCCCVTMASVCQWRQSMKDTFPSKQLMWAKWSGLFGWGMIYIHSHEVATHVVSCTAANKYPPDINWLPWIHRGYLCQNCLWAMRNTYFVKEKVSHLSWTTICQNSFGADGMPQLEYGSSS